MSTRRVVAAALLLFCLSGCRRGGGGGGHGDIVDVQPKELVRGRQMTITVVGDGTDWSDIDTGDVEVRTIDGEVDPSIAVIAVNPANDQYLQITFDIAVDSLRAPRNLRIGGERLDGVVEVVPPFEIVEATDVAPGHFFRLSVRGVQTDWIPGTVVVESSAPEVLLTGAKVSPNLYGDPEPHVTALGVEVLRNDFLYLTGYVEFFAPPGPVDLSIVSPGAADLFPAAIAVSPLDLIDLTAPTSIASTLSEPFETHVYRAPLPADSSCALDYYWDDFAGQLVSLEVFNPAEPQSVLIGDFRYWSYGYYYSGLVWNPEERIVVVHDLGLGGGEDYAYGLTWTCEVYAPTALTEGVPLAAQTMAAPGELKTYDLTLSPWTYVDVAFQEATVADPEAALYLEGPVDLSPYNYAAIETPETVRMFSGTRTRALAQVYDYNDGTGADSEFTVTFTETSPPGTRFVSAEPAEAIPDGITIGDYQSYTDSLLTVPAGTLPGALHIAVDVQHRYASDVSIDLLSPQGSKVRLSDGEYGLWNYGFEDVTDVFGLGIDDNDPAGVPTTGGFVDLATVEAENPVGTWTLRVYDTFPEDSGILRGWALFVE